MWDREPRGRGELHDRPRCFLRWLAAGSEADVVAAAERVLAAGSIVWEECGTWTTDGPAVLMDSAMAGADLKTECPCPGGGPPDQAPVPLTAGRWKVRAVHTETDGHIETDGHTWVGLVQLLPTGP